jgi:hypothetical protein
MIVALTICLVARGQPSATPAASLEEGKQTMVASATTSTIPRTNEPSKATPTPLLGTSGQSTTTASTPGLGPECGNIDMASSGKLLGPANARQVQDCFWEAYQQCRPAILTLIIHVADGVSTHTFKTQKQGSCVVSDTIQNSIAGLPSSQPETYNCARLEKTQTALHFVNCGDEDIIDIPSS